MRQPACCCGCDDVLVALQGIYNRQRVRREVEDMVADLQLVDKAKIQSSRLSGGMKRKLRQGRLDSKSLCI